MTIQERDSSPFQERRGRTLPLAVLLSCLSAAAIGPAAVQGQESGGTRLAVQPQGRRGAPPAVPRTSPGRGGAATVSVVFTKADVRDVLTQIAGYTHADILVTPGATGSISIN